MVNSVTINQHSYEAILVLPSAIVNLKHAPGLSGGKDPKVTQAYKYAVHTHGK